MNLKFGKSIPFDDKNGTVLIYVMILTLVLTLVAVVLISEATWEHRLTIYDIERQQLFYGADSGIELARGLLVDGFRYEDSAELSLSLGEMGVTLSMDQIQSGPVPEEGEPELTVNCISTATMTGISGRNNKLTIQAQFLISPEGEVCVTTYRWNHRT